MIRVVELTSQDTTVFCRSLMLVYLFIGVDAILCQFPCEDANSNCNFLDQIILEKGKVSP
jgi:hypothetical protein